MYADIIVFCKKSYINNNISTLNLILEKGADNCVLLNVY